MRTLLETRRRASGERRRGVVTEGGKMTANEWLDRYARIDCIDLHARISKRACVLRRRKAEIDRNSTCWTCGRADLDVSARPKFVNLISRSKQ